MYTRRLLLDEPDDFDETAQIAPNDRQTTPRHRVVTSAPGCISYPIVRAREKDRGGSHKSSAQWRA
jgi:hypothetical protein